jgi:predicted Zn-dependent peptidase
MDNTLAHSISIFKAADIEIPFKKYTLANGLRLIVHEDFKAPIVAVNIWYHVGAKNEKPGKSGFAHLFEHLMFNGSENFNTDYFQALEAIGATDLNGTTNHDRTNYFQNVPVGALDQVLWLESDRMGHLVGAIDQAKLDEQRGVVINEKKQGENQPYSKEDDLFNEAMFPKGHPYSWSVIGSMEDIQGATVQDVHEWFKAYYGAANAILVIAGAIKAEDALDKVNDFFGHIPSGPMISRNEINIPVRHSHTRQEYQDRVPEAKISLAWNIPQWGTKESAYFDLIAAILSAGKTSRLYKKMIYDEQLATSVSAYNYAREICGNFLVECKIKNGNSIEKIETLLNEILTDFIEYGPTVEELTRVKSQYFAAFIKGVERIGGFGGKSDVLAENEIYADRPDYYKLFNQYIEEATLKDLQQVAKLWLGRGSHTIIANPFPDYETGPVVADRSQMPALGYTPPSSFPSIEHTSLDNGLNIVLARRKDSPTVIISLMMNGGYSSDVIAGKPGLSSIAMNMLDEGTLHMNALEISEKLSMLGASIKSVADLDKCYLILECLKVSLEQSLDVFADILLHPSFPLSDFTRIKSLQIAGIQREKVHPVQMAMRVISRFLYGERHPYGLPLSGVGFEESVENITLEDVKMYYDKWITPVDATIQIVGDIALSEIKNKLAAKLHEWKGTRPPAMEIPLPEVSSKKTLYFMHRPEVEQSVILAGYTIAPYGAISEIAKEPLINILGGDFTSRINLNLREDKHWTYGAGAFIKESIGTRPFVTYTQVQIDKTKESIEEIIKEFNWITGEKPITSEEFDKTKNNQVMALPGIWETNAAVSGSLSQLIKYKLPSDYWVQYSENVRALSLEEVQNLGKKLIDSSKLQWFIVSNKDVVLDSLKSLTFDEIIQVDGDGNLIEKIV